MKHVIEPVTGDQASDSERGTESPEGGPKPPELIPTGLFNQLLETELVTVREVQRVA